MALMNLITLEHANKSFGDKLLYQDVKIQINQKDKIALIAKNGNGKSSLLRVLAGQEKPEGENAYYFKARDINIGVLEQDPHFTETHTVMQHLLNIPREDIQALAQYKKVQKEQNRELLKVSELMEKYNAWNVEAEIYQLIDQLKLDSRQIINTLSGGQKKRLALAKLILSKPDVYLLDEPTNHLDLQMIEWLEKFLSNPNINFVMVTHDRYFLDRVCNQIVELYQQKLFFYKGSYRDFLKKKTEYQKNLAEKKEKTDKYLKKELQWINKMPKARTTKNKARIDAFYELKAANAITVYEDRISIPIEVRRLGSKILELHRVSKTLGKKSILQSFSYKFARQDRLGIVGTNGVGKSTLVKMIMGLLPPDSGKIIIGDTVKFGYFGQEGLQPKQDKTIIEIVREIAEYIPLKKGKKLSAEALLEHFLFPRSQQTVYYSQLSGGEKRRLYLLTILMSNPNFLILDEPTNDLDIITLNVLEEFLLQFSGCLIIISHDRYMLDKTVNHLFVMEGNGQITDFPGSYTSYIASKTTKYPQQKQAINTTKTNAYEQKKEIKKLERSIEKINEKINKIQEQFLNPNLSLEQIQQLQKMLHPLNEELKSKEKEWEKRVESLD